MGSDLTDRDAAPAAVEGADNYGQLERPSAEAASLRAFNKRQIGKGRTVHRADVWYEAWCAALTWVAARPAPAAAPREGGELFTEAELRTYAENLLAMGSGPHAASGRSILAMVQFLTTAHRQAAREAARGEG